jgi:copper(I)-binding protein
MRRVDALAIAGGKSVVLAPGGYHIMLTDLRQPLKEGDLLKLTLVFEKAGAIEVEATVEPVGAMGPHGFDHQPGAGKAATGSHGH